MDKLPMTAEGLARLEVELKELKSVERPAVIKAIAVAREHGDLKENAEPRKHGLNHTQEETGGLNGNHKRPAHTPNGNQKNTKTSSLLKQKSRTRRR